METVTVSKKYQVVIPEKLRKEANIKPGDKMVAITKHGIIQYIPMCPFNEAKGFITGQYHLKQQTSASNTTCTSQTP